MKDTEKKTAEEIKAEFIKKWRLQPADGYGSARFDCSENLKRDLDDLISAVVEERIKERMPSDEEIENKVDLLMIDRGEHPTRVRNPIYGEERKLTNDLFKWLRSKLEGKE